MVIVQEAYDIPDEIVNGIETGKYKRYGSVIRNRKGHIVKLLDPLDMEHLNQNLISKDNIIQQVKKHKKGIVVTTIGVTVIGTGLGIYYKIRNKDLKEVTEFQKALKKYIEAIRKGSLNIDVIMNLMNALENIKKHKDYNKITIQITTGELEVLVDYIYEYTFKLAIDNNIEIEENKLNVTRVEQNNPITNLQICLKNQRQIFETVS